MRYLITDLETLPDESVRPLLDPVKAPSNYKKPEAIAAAIAEKETERNEKLALHPDYCRIAVLGYHVVGGGDPVAEVCFDAADEISALKRFWQAYEGPTRLVTFFGLKFDLPILMRRSLYLGVPYPTLNLDKFRTPHIDICQKLSFNGAIETHSLNFYCRRLGILIDDPVSGADVGRLWAEGNHAAVIDHCLADLGKTHALANKLGLLQLTESYAAQPF